MRLAALQAVTLALVVLSGCDTERGLSPTEPLSPSEASHASAPQTLPQELSGLGGSASSAWDINENGVAAGSATGPTNVTQPVLWENGQAKVLGGLGGAYGNVMAVAKGGEAAGWVYDLNGVWNAVFWSASGALTRMGTLPGTNGAFVRDVNDMGAVVGYTFTPSQPYRAFLWQNGTMTELPALQPGGMAVAAGINEHGQVAGYTASPQGARAVVWINGTPHSLMPAHNLPDSYAVAISDKGTAVGNSNGNGREHATVWKAGSPALLDDLGARSSRARDVNSHDEIVGYARMQDGTTHALYWDAAGAVTDLGTLGGDHAWAEAINDNGEIVGRSQTFDGSLRATLWIAPRGGGSMKPPARLDYLCREDIPGALTPAGYYWVRTGYNANCQPSALPNAYIFEYFRDKPVGTEMEVCYNQVPAFGWEHVGDPLSYEPVQGWARPCGFGVAPGFGDVFLLSWRVPIRRVF